MLIENTHEDADMGWRSILALLLLVGTTSAVAETEHWFPWYKAYVSVGGGLTSLDYSASNALTAAGVQAAEVDDSSERGFRLAAGYYFLDWLGVELAYTDLDDYRATAAAGFATSTAAPGQQFPITQTLDFEAKGYELSAVVLWPLAYDFSLRGKLGAFYADTDTRATGFIDLAGGPFFQTGIEFDIAERERSNTDLTYAIGLDYALHRRVSLALEHQWYADVGGSEIEFTSANLYWRF